MGDPRPDRRRGRLRRGGGPRLRPCPPPEPRLAVDYRMTRPLLMLTIALLAGAVVAGAAVAIPRVAAPLASAPLASSRAGSTLLTGFSDPGYERPASWDRWLGRTAS